MTSAEREQVEGLRAAYHELRQSKFNAGQPFQILSKKLPSDQYYLEYVDGKIIIEHIKIIGGHVTATTVRELTQVEAFKIRREYGLF